MENKNMKGSASRALSLGLLAVTAATMTPAVVPGEADPAFAGPKAKAEATALSGAVELNGPSGSKSYEDKINGKYWFDKSGSFTVNIDESRYTGVQIVVNGAVVVDATEVTADKNEFSLNITDDSNIKVSAGQFTEEVGFVEEDVTNFNVGIDSEAPSVTGNVTGKNTKDGNTTYITKDTTFKLNPVDPGSGVSDVYFQKKGDLGWSDEIKGDTLKGKSGQWRVKVVDNLGNSNVLSFKEVFGVPGTLKIVDEGDQNTKITATVDGKSISDSWLPGRDGSDRKSHEVKVKIKKSSGIHLGDNITVNGTDPNAKKTTDDDGNSIYTFDITDIPRADDGIYNMVAESRYIFGITTREEYEIKVDYGNPEINNAKLSGDYTIEDGKIFINGDAYFNGTLADVESGVKKVKVYRKVGDTKKEVPHDLTGDALRFKLLQGNGYYIEVTDNVGNKISKTLQDLDLGGKDVIEDTDKPNINETDGKKADYVSPGKENWFKEDFPLKFSITDDNMRSVRVEVNGQVSTPKLSESDNYVVDLKDYTPADGSRYDITITATDKANNVSEFSRTLYVDSDAPKDISASLEGSYKDRDFGVFSKEDLILHAKGNDGSGAGIAGYQLINTKTGEVVKDSKDGNIKLSNGAYSLVVYDNLGNKTKPVTLKELLGTKSNEFHVDSVAPKIDVDRKDPIYKNWYNDDVSYTARFSDNTALYNGTVRINGEEVATFTSSKIEKNRQLTFNTNQVKPGDSGAYEIVVEGTDAAGNTVKWDETIRIDNTDPEIKSFTFTDPGFKEGESITKSDDYGYFFKGATSVNIKVEDAGASAGVKEVAYVLRNGNGSVQSRGTAAVSGNSARVQIPAHFKGYIDAYAVDNVKNSGKTVHPSGIITEDRNWYVNTTDIDINVPDPGHKDHKNQNLYNSDVTATVPIRQGVSGIREVEWGVGDNTLGKATADINGHLSGSGFSIQERDKNLILKVNGSLGINGNSNDMKVWVRVVDRAGYTSDMDKTISIDKDAPKIDVSYNDTIKSGYYSSNRVATIRINERNFDPKDVELSGKYGSIGTWRQSGDVWTNTITFSEETEYQWGLEYTDMAGNKGQGYKSEEFTIDKTAPKLSVDFNNNSANNGNFYKEGRTATVEIIDRNFDPARVNYRGDGKLSGWSHNGDRHTARVSFNEDGEYQFSIDSTDKADNKSNVYKGDKFIVDTSKPKLRIEGVKQGTSYKKDVGVKVITEDKYIDAKASKVSLIGRERGAIKLDGKFDAKTGSFVIENFPKKKEMDDLYKLQAHIVDKAGNVEKKDITFSVNRFGSNFDFLTKDFNGEYFQELPSNVVMEHGSLPLHALLRTGPRH